jgi:hypothetical protein
VADRLSSLNRKNKPDPYAASRDFINAILCAERPILTKKNKTEGAYDLDAVSASPVRAHKALRQVAVLSGHGARCNKLKS